MLPWLVGALGGKLKLFIVTAVVVAGIGGLAFASYQIFQFGKSSCQAEIQEAVENERARRVRRIQQLETKLQEARRRAEVRVRTLSTGNDPSDCADTAAPGWMLDTLRPGAD